MGSEYPVKRLDEKNKAPKFTIDGAYTGTDASTYRAERREDTTRRHVVTTPATPIPSKSLKRWLRSTSLRTTADNPG